MTVHWAVDRFHHLEQVIAWQFGKPIAAVRPFAEVSTPTETNA